MAKNKYTIIAIYPNEGETFTEHVTANTTENACKKFWKTRDPEDTGTSIVEILKGHCKSVMDVCWIDHPDSIK